MRGIGKTRNMNLDKVEIIIKYLFNILIAKKDTVARNHCGDVALISYSQHIGEALVNEWLPINIRYQHKQSLMSLADNIFSDLKIHSAFLDYTIAVAWIQIIDSPSFRSAKNATFVAMV